MEHFTDNPVADAQDHIRSTDAQDHVYDHQCCACEHGFDHGHGKRISDEKFCNTCIDEFKHFEFYRNVGLTNREIYQATDDTEDL